MICSGFPDFNSDCGKWFGKIYRLIEKDLQYLIVFNKSKKILTPPECTWVIMINLN